MKARSKASKTKQGNDSMTLNPIAAMQPHLPLFVTAGLVQPSKKTTLLDRLLSCENNTQTQKSSKTLGADSTLSGKDCGPYWSDLCAAISSRLLLPVETGSVDSGLNYSSSWQNKTVAQSWFLTKLFTVHNPNLLPIFLPSFTPLVAECTGLEVTVRRSRKIRIFLNPDQKGQLKHWFGVSRYVYNKTIEYQGRVVALDPGVRTFIIFFSESSYGWLGNDSNLFIQKRCFKLDKLISAMSKAKSRQKCRLKKAANRIKAKVQHLVKELHHKTALFLVDNVDVILLPSFESSQMVSKSRRRIKSQTVRQMLTLSHYQFKKHLEWKAWGRGKVALTDINEAYTSKTVSWADEVKKIGGSRGS